MNSAKEIIAQYLNFSGERSADEIKSLLDRATEVKTRSGSDVDKTLLHIRQQLTRAYFAALGQRNKKINIEIDDSSITDSQLGKFRDRGDVPDGGRQDEFWNFNRPKIQFEPKNTRIRKGPALPSSLRLDDEAAILDHFGLRAIEYGQWLTQQDRVNYLAGCALAMHDLAAALNFTPKQIGLFGILSVAFGARGRGKALGHFEPDTYAVNLTRFKRPKAVNYRSSKYDRSAEMFFSGGIGTFCHEFGHALDYFAGMFVEPAPPGIKGRERKQWLSLSFHRSTRAFPDKDLMKKNTLRGKMERLLHKIIWKAPSEHTAYYERVIITCQAMQINSEYWLQRNELFARAFEVYVLNKMHQKGWFNVFLQKLKYESPMYMTGTEFHSVEKEFDALLSGLRSAVRNGVGSFEKLPIAVQMRAAKRKPAKRK